MVSPCHYARHSLSKASIRESPLYQHIHTSSDTGTDREDARIISSDTRRIYARAAATSVYDQRTFDHTNIRCLTITNCSNSNRTHLFCC